MEASGTVGSVVATNLTVTDHLGVGLYFYFPSPASGYLGNSIAWNNPGGDALLFGGAVTSEANLIGVDPQFAAPAAGDYRLAAGSDAIDAGTPSPAGGLGTFDAAHAPRVAGAAPDQGAYERNALFGDDFESGDAGAWD